MKPDQLSYLKQFRLAIMVQLKQAFAFITTVFIFETVVTAINLLPCTENVTAVEMAAALNILEDATPPGYTLRNHKAIVQTGRRPHRWVAQYTRNDNYYSSGCDYLTRIKNEFKKFQPQGSAVSNVQILSDGTSQTIQVELMVHCECTNIARQRRNAPFLTVKECTKN